MTEQRWRTAIAGLAGAAAIAGCSTADGTVGVDPSASSAIEPLDGGRDSEEPRYQDGTHQADGWYGSLPSSIGVELSLAGGVITDVDVTTHATDPTSLDHQERFADAVPEVVVGRRIDEVQVSRLAGSSGTPDGFNDALDRIKREAESR